MRCLWAAPPSMRATPCCLTDQRGFTRPADLSAVENAGGSNGSDIGAFELQPELASLVVTTTMDVVNDADSVTSLREAINFANSQAGADTIKFDSTVFSGGSDSLIRLRNGELQITESLTIDGSSGADVVISGDAVGNDTPVSGTFITDVAASLNANSLADNSRVLNFTAGSGDLTLTGLTITGGRNAGSGGGIYSLSGAVLLTSSTVSGNSSGDSGGGIYTNSGAVTLTSSTVSGNRTENYGGGISSYSGGVTLAGSTVANNSSSIDGGGVFVFDTAINATLTIQNSIIAGNTATEAAPDLRPDPSSTLDIDFSLIGDATGSGVTAATGTGNLLNVDALLGPLADNGGSTLTHALIVGSPAIDAGNDALAVDGNNQPLPFDQRGNGFARIDGNKVDIGAFELNIAPTLLSFTRQTPNSPSTNSDTLTFWATFSEDVTLVDASDFVVDGSTTATITNVATINVRTYDITVSGGDLASFNGTVGLNVDGSNNIADLAGNALTPGEPPTDETFTVDNIAPQVDSIAYEDGSAQRSVIRSITVNFDSEVITDPGAFVLTTKSGTNIPLVDSSTLVGGKTRVLLTFSGDQVDASGSLIDGNYRLTILDSHVRDIAGNVLDGNKDGSAGGAAVDEFFRFFGDSDGDRDVDGSDLSRFLATYRKGSQQSGFSPVFDWDNDDDVDGTDLSRFLARYRKRLSES